MRSFIFFLTTLFFLNMTTQAQTNNSADDAAIRKLAKDMEDGWAKKDGKLFAAPFAENADYVVVNGLYVKGREAIARGHQVIFDSFYKETFIKADAVSIRYIRPDIAIVHCDASMSGVSYGNKVDTKSKITLVVEKTAAGWQIDAFQNTHVTEEPARTGN